MKFRYTYWYIALILFCFSCASTQTNSIQSNELAGTELEPFGRYMIQGKQPLELISSGVHVGYSYEGYESQVFASVPAANAHGYLQYELDGKYHGRVKINPGEPMSFTIRSSTNGKHTVWLYKATEARMGPILIHKVTGDDITAIRKPEAPVIEFIGNSITSGAASDPSEIPCGTAAYHDQHNAYLAYGPSVARALGANFVLSSVSGFGIYRNWNNSGPTLPQVYEKLDFQENNTRLWDFETYTPAIVSIALGTNDLSKGDGVQPRLPFDSTRFVNEYIKFVHLIKDIYPSAQIALLSSPMIAGKNKTTLENSLTAIKEKIDAAYPKAKPVALHFFTSLQANGCLGHPSVEDHAVMATALEPFYKALLPAK
jgi:lysophospholipase L1-like esterase